MSAVLEQVPAKTVKPKAEVEAVLMEDGRTVNFAGKRKMLKETLLDESKIEIDDSGVIQMQQGAVKLRMDWRSGVTRTLDLPFKLFPKYIGHGAEQKFGDELATPADKPMTEDDQVLAIETLHDLHKKGQWGAGRAEGGGGVSGAGVVVQAILAVQNERRAANGKPALALEDIKNYLQKLLDGDSTLTRAAMYASFRAGDTPYAVKIKEIDAAKLAKTAKLDVGDAMAGLDEA